MAYQFFWLKSKWVKMDPHANVEINLALSQDDPPEEIDINHWWTNKQNRQMLTVYKINFAQMNQTSSDNGTIRCIYGHLMYDKKTKFDWLQFQKEKAQARSQVQRVEPSSTCPMGDVWSQVQRVEPSAKADGEVVRVLENQQMVGTGSQPSATADGGVVRAWENQQIVETGSQPRETVTWLGDGRNWWSQVPVTIVPPPAPPVPAPDATIVPLRSFGYPVPPAPRVRSIQNTYCSEPELFGAMGDVGSQPMNNAGDGVPAAPPPPPAMPLGGKLPAAPPPLAAVLVRSNFKAAPPTP